MPRNPADRPATEPRTEAGRRLWDYAYGISRLEVPGARMGALSIMRRDILAIEAEAAQGAAPRAEGLTRNLLAEAIFESVVRQTMSQAEKAADNILAELDVIRSRPSDERVPVSEAGE